jgi:hypothetical protein
MNYLPTVLEARTILPDPAPTWRWVVAMPVDVGTTLVSPYSISPGGSAYYALGLLPTPVIPLGRVERIDLPGITIDTDPRFTAATKTHYPRFMEVENCTINFFEDNKYTSLRYLRSWREMIVDRDHNYYPSSYYKRSIFFFAFGIKSNYTPALIGEIKGTFPINPGSGLSYEYNQSGYVTIPCTFSVDEVELFWNQAEAEGQKISPPSSTTPSKPSAPSISPPSVPSIPAPESQGTDNPWVYTFGA